MGVRDWKGTAKMTVKKLGEIIGTTGDTGGTATAGTLIAKVNAILKGQGTQAAESTSQEILEKVTKAGSKYVASDTEQFALASKSVSKGIYTLFAMDTEYDGHIRLKADSVTWNTGYGGNSVTGWCIIPITTDSKFYTEDTADVEKYRSQILNFSTGTTSTLFGAPNDNGKVCAVPYGFWAKSNLSNYDYCVDIPVKAGGRLVVLLVAYSASSSYATKVTNFSVCYDIE